MEKQNYTFLKNMYVWESYRHFFYPENKYLLSTERNKVNINHKALLQFMQKRYTDFSNDNI